MASFTPKLSRIIEETPTQRNEHDSGEEEDVDSILKEYEILTETDLLIALDLDPTTYKKGEYLDGVKYKEKNGDSFDSDFYESYDESLSTNGQPGYGNGNFTRLHSGAQAKNMAIMERFRSRPDILKNIIGNKDDLNSSSISVPEDRVSLTSDSSTLSKISKRRRISRSSTCLRNGDEMLKEYLHHHQGYEFDSKEGRKIFVKSILKKYMAMYYVVSPPQVTSIDFDGSGLATLLAVRSALKMKEKPGDKDEKESVISGGESVVTSCIMFDCLVNEMTFHEFTCIAKLNNLSVQAVQVNKETDIKMFRRDIKESCVSNKRICVCLYSCNHLFRSNGASFALIGGYYKEKDLVLLFDPSRTKIPPFWIPLGILFDAMAIKKESEFGYFLLEKAENDPYILLNVNRKISIMLSAPLQHYEKLCDLKDSWEQWLLSPYSTTYGIIDSAIGSIMEILCKQSFKQTHIHEEEAKLTYKQGSLVDFLTRSKTFPIIEKRVGLLDSILLTKLTIFAEWLLETVFIIRKPKKTKMKSQKRKKLVKTSVNMNKFNNSIMLTTWLLFWPYAEEDDKTNNASLRESIRVDLLNFPAALVGTFHTQMASVIDLIESSTLHTCKDKVMINQINERLYHQD